MGRTSRGAAPFAGSRALAADTRPLPPRTKSSRFASPRSRWRLPRGSEC